MSIIPYNSDNEIVFYDSRRGIILAHDEESNSLQLLTTIESGEDHGSRSRKYGDKKFKHGRFGRRTSSPNSIECPNCGFSWENLPHFNTTTKDTSNILIQSPEAKEGLSPNVSKQLMIMHHEYFKYLGRLARPQQHQIQEDEILPENIFNQGYFDRFFKKVFPYELGSGAHAKVYKVVHVLNDIKIGTFAVKRIGIADRINYLEQVLNEVLILYELSVNGANENNLIRYNHVWIEMGDLNDSSTYIMNDGDNKAIEQPAKIPYVFILQQYCDGGHLESLIKKNYQSEDYLSFRDQVERERNNRRRARTKSATFESDSHPKKWLSSFEIFKFFRDIVRGVDYLHVNGILHRDLKPSNCLLESKYTQDIDIGEFQNNGELEESLLKLPRVLVSDFGEGKFIDKRKTDLRVESRTVEGSSESSRRGNTGTLEFTAPELWILTTESNNQTRRKFVKDFTFDSDVYSLGLILCFLCVGELPFTDTVKGLYDPMEIKEAISSWFVQVTRKAFRNWFISSSKTGDTEIDMRCNQLFAELIFAMIKGDQEVEQNGKRLSCSEILACLERIKRETFLACESDLKDGKIAEMRENHEVANNNIIRVNEHYNEFDAADDVGVELTDTTGYLADPVLAKNSIYSERVNFRLPDPKFFVNDFVLTGIYFCNFIVLEYLTYEATNILYSMIRLLTLSLLVLDLSCFRFHRFRYYLSTIVTILTLITYLGWMS